jgi:hypothetical protein
MDADVDGDGSINYEGINSKIIFFWLVLL